MDNENNITEELKKMNHLLMEIKKTEVYSVPAHYFNHLSDEILNKLDLNKERAYFLGSITPYSTPAEYFNDLPALILQNILRGQKRIIDVFEEMEEIAPLLNTITKKPVYTTPINFLDNIQLPPAESQKPKAKVVSIKRRSKLLRIAAAAVIIPILAIGLYTLTGKEVITVRSNTDNAKNKVKNLSKEEIVNYLKRNSIIEDASSTSENSSVDDNEIKSSLKQISDKEIQQFLKETGESDEI